MFLSSRLKTGIVLLSIVSVVAYVNNFVLIWLIFGVILWVGIVESSKLFNLEIDRNEWLIYLFIWAFTLIVSNPLDLFFLALILFASKEAFFYDSKKGCSRLNSIFPLFYPLLPILFWLILYKDFGIGSLIWVLFVVAGTDTGAYFIGKKFGKRSFSPSSPNKTLEGVVGGIFVGTLFGTLASNTIDILSLNPLLISILISLVVSISSVFGDLFESFLKREAGVKDSGEIFPGHGGVLDRIDGYTFGIPVAVILLKAL